MSKPKAVYFQDAVRWLGCTAPWLTKQIDKGLVRFTLESDGKGAHRYLLNRDDLECLFNTVPTYRAQEPHVVVVIPTVQRKARHSAELIKEAHDLGMTVEEYKREMGI